MLVNGKVVLPDLDIANQYGLATAVYKKVMVSVSDSKGIKITFNAKAGEPIINALQLIKL